MDHENLLSIIITRAEWFEICSAITATRRLVCRSNAPMSFAPPPITSSVTALVDFARTLYPMRLGRPVLANPIDRCKKPPVEENGRQH
jgi:hypothetical protein